MKHYQILYISEYVWMDSDYLEVLMRRFDDNHEEEQKVPSSDNFSNNENTRNKDRELHEIEVKEEIDDAEPTFYNDSTKIELQFNESPRVSEINEETLEDIGNCNEQKNKR